MANWYYEKQGKQAGPVSDAELAELERSGGIRPATLVWTSGMSNWQPYASVLGQQVAGGEAGTPCSQCGRSFDAGELVKFGDVVVCAGCKPLYLQRRLEGVPAFGIQDAWRSGKILVARDGAALPARCVKCGVDVSSPLISRKVYWHSPWLYLLVLVNIFVYVIVALIVRKQARLEIAVCDSHRSRRRLAIIGGVLGIAGGLALAITGIQNLGPEWVLVGFLVVIAGLIVAGRVGAYLVPRRIKEGVVWVNGAGPDFLAPLPEWKGTP